MSTQISQDAVNRLKTDGFLLLRLAEVAYQTVNSTFEAAYPFFRAPLEEKILNKLSQDSGYRPMGVEYSQAPERPDLVESFTASFRTRAEITRLPLPNAQLLFERMLNTIDAFESIAEAITIRLADELSENQAGEKLKGAFRQWSRLQLNYSRPASATATFINETHEDGDLLTVACATGPGFELQAANEEFIPITTAPDEVLVIPGEIAWLLSGGLIKPMYHCVRPEPCERERMALLFFGDIHPQLCEPWIKSEVNANVDIGARVLTNATRYGLHGFTLE
jgi:isopenicillin N synthase-like dioxygenase